MQWSPHVSSPIPPSPDTLDSVDALHSTLTQMDLAVLTQRCAAESRRFYRYEPNDPRYSYELFRRAIAERNQEAWVAIYDLYAPLVERWVRCSGAFRSASESCEYFVSAAFTRFYGSMTPEKFANSTTLGGLLTYLQRCTLGAVIDNVRAQPRGGFLPVEIIPVDQLLQTAPDEEALTRVNGVEFWRYIDTQLHSAAERLVIYQSFVFGMRPGEIYQQHPELFVSVQAVYTTKRNVLDRLRRNAELRQMLFN